jgi:HlyD family secretion protein
MVEQALPFPKQKLKTRFSAALAWSGFLAHRWFVLTVIVLLGLGAWQGVRVLFGPAVVVDQVARGRLIESVVASGHVETPYRVEIGSQITGTVEDVLVQEGKKVAKGQPLIALESRELKATVVQAQGAVAQAEARIRQLEELTLPSAKEALTQAQATLLNAQQTYDRTIVAAAEATGCEIDLAYAT